MRTESAVKAAMVNKARAAKWYARRFEDQYAVGTPDVMLVPPGGPVYWIEVKILRGATYGPTPRQAEELRRLGETGAVVPLVGGYRVSDHYISFYKWKGQNDVNYTWVDFRFFLGAIKEHGL